MLQPAGLPCQQSRRGPAFRSPDRRTVKSSPGGHKRCLGDSAVVARAGSIIGVLRGILFDFNGVLLDDERLHFELFQQLLREQGIELEEHTYYRELVQFDDEAGFRHALGADESGSEPMAALVADLCERKASSYRQRIAVEGYPLFPGAASLVRAAAADGLALGVVSGALRSEIVPALRAAGLEPLLQVLVAAEDVESSKPDPAGYCRGLELLNRGREHSSILEPMEVLAIEDTDGGIEAASAAGLATLGVAHTLPLARLARADFTADSLAEVDLDLLYRYLEPNRSSELRATSISAADRVARR